MCGEDDQFELCDGGVSAKYEYEECYSSNKLVVYGGKDTELDTIKTFVIDENTVKTEFMTPKGDTTTLPSNGDVLCSGSVKENYYVVMSVMDDTTGETVLSTYIFNWTKFSLIRTTMSQPNRESAACTFYSDQIWLCGGWNPERGVLGSCEVFDGEF